jgi:hypothetical protein
VNYLLFNSVSFFLVQENKCQLCGDNLPSVCEILTKPESGPNCGDEYWHIQGVHPMDHEFGDPTFTGWMQEMLSFGKKL